MAQELVWAQVGRFRQAVSRGRAESAGYVVLDESPYERDGGVRRPTRANGRPVKPRTSVAKEAAKKAAAKDSPAEVGGNAAHQAAEVIAEPASVNEKEENAR